ncbi:MAG TPA: hypothetical protein VGN09_14725 [Vicinamibacteria bacterium]
MTRRVAGALLVLGLGFGRAAAQAPEAGAGKASSTMQRVLGEVTRVDAAGRRISLTTDDGEQVVVTTDDKTSFLRAEPGARDLSRAAPLTLAEIAVGDRLLARGTLAEDKKTLAARQAVVMGRSDIARRHEQERAEWRRRGVSGVIKALDPAAAQITVETRSLVGSQTVLVATADRHASFKRYAPESVRFSDVVPSSFAELQVGDQLRVLGDRTPDGAKLMAEQVVSGAFQIVSGAVKAVKAREVTIVDNETGKPLTIVAGPDAVMRRLPPEMAARLARRLRRSSAARPEGPPAPREPSEDAAAGGRRMEGSTLQDMLERLPPMPIEELKTGDQIAVSSPKSHVPGRVTAAVLLAGIEPLLESRPRGAAGAGEAVGLAPGALDLGLGVP